MAGDGKEKEKLVFLARMAEQAERYDEMASLLDSVCERVSELTIEERNLLSVAYKNAVGARRAAFRIVTSVVQKELAKGNAQQAGYAEDYLKKIVEELEELNNKVLSILTTKLVHSARAPESKVFYIKMQGDYERYKAEYSRGPARAKASNSAKEAYDRAYQLARAELAVTSPIRLGLALNYSVFEYEVLNNPSGACTMAKKAFEDAIAELDNVAEETYKDSTLIMQLLRDNLTLWTSEDGDVAAAQGQQGAAR